MYYEIVNQKGKFKLRKEDTRHVVKVLEATNHWDALEEANKKYPDDWISSCIDGSVGDLILAIEFVDMVDTGCFLDYDGFGYAYDKDFNKLDYMVYPSEISKIPPEAEYVLWFNR